VGSECGKPENFYNAIKTGSEFQNLLSSYQRKPINTIDIGGGFLSDAASLQACAHEINKARYKYFNPASNSVAWIAEPGRYFASTFFTLYVPIIGKKRRIDGEGWRYTINESIYGSFSNIPFDHQRPVPIPLKMSGRVAKIYPAEIYGRTCDSGDCLGKEFKMPEMDEGDWLRFDNMGAYTTVTASEFNGFPKPELYIEE
jgi:ornithine decarboxylase